MAEMKPKVAKRITTSQPHPTTPPPPPPPANPNSIPSPFRKQVKQTEIGSNWFERGLSLYKVRWYSNRQPFSTDY